MRLLSTQLPMRANHHMKGGRTHHSGAQDTARHRHERRASLHHIRYQIGRDIATILYTRSTTTSCLCCNNCQELVIVLSFSREECTSESLCCKYPQSKARGKQYSQALAGRENMAATQASPPASSIYSKYAISSAWEITLQDGEVVEGLVYCADPSAGIVVLRDNADTRIISISAIRESKQTKEATTTVQPSTKDITHTKKALEEREKRAIKLAQESIKHLNPKVCLVFCIWKTLPRHERVTNPSSSAIFVPRLL